MHSHVHTFICSVLSLIFMLVYVVTFCFDQLLVKYFPNPVSWDDSSELSVLATILRIVSSHAALDYSVVIYCG